MKKAKQASKATRRPALRPAGESSNESIARQNRKTAKYIAMVIRNAMEDFHAKHLTDAQMRELNPVIRNAAYTALHALHNADTDPGAAAFVGFAQRCIPKYWEEPELLPDYLQTMELFRAETEPGS